jgi:hypothetical protein
VFYPLGEALADEFRMQIMAISASLDDDDLDNYEEPDSPLQKGGFDVADETKKHLPFESTDMRVSNHSFTSLISC